MYKLKSNENALYSRIIAIEKRKARKLKHDMEAKKRVDEIGREKIKKKG